MALQRSSNSGEIYTDDVATLLEGHGLGEYVQVFRDKGYTDVEDVAALDHQSFTEKLGISRPGHRAKILRLVCGHVETQQRRYVVLVEAGIASDEWPAHVGNASMLEIDAGRDVTIAGFKELVKSTAPETLSHCGAHTLKVYDNEDKSKALHATLPMKETNKYLYVTYTPSPVEPLGEKFHSLSVSPVSAILDDKMYVARFVPSLEKDLEYINAGRNDKQVILSFIGFSGSGKTWAAVRDVKRALEPRQTAVKLVYVLLTEEDEFDVVDDENALKRIIRWRQQNRVASDEHIHLVVDEAHTCPNLCRSRAQTSGGGCLCLVFCGFRPPLGKFSSNNMEKVYLVSGWEGLECYDSTVYFVAYLMGEIKWNDPLPQNFTKEWTFWQKRILSWCRGNLAACSRFATVMMGGTKRILKDDPGALLIDLTVYLTSRNGLRGRPLSYFSESRFQLLTSALLFSEVRVTETQLNEVLSLGVVSVNPFDDEDVQGKRTFTTSPFYWRFWVLRAKPSKMVLYNGYTPENFEDNIVSMLLWRYRAMQDGYADQTLQCLMQGACGLPSEDIKLTLTSPLSVHKKLTTTIVPQRIWKNKRENESEEAHRTRIAGLLHNIEPPCAVQTRPREPYADALLLLPECLILLKFKFDGDERSQGCIDEDLLWNEYKKCGFCACRTRACICAFKTSAGKNLKCHPQQVCTELLKNKCGNNAFFCVVSDCKQSCEQVYYPPSTLVVNDTNYSAFLRQFQYNIFHWTAKTRDTEDDDSAIRLLS